MTDGNRKALVIIEHSTDLILILIEMFLTRTFLTLKAGIYPVIVALLFTFWTWIFVYNGFWSWPYGFFEQVLNPNEKPWLITVVALLAGFVAVYLIFLIVYGTFRLREALGQKKLQKLTGESTDDMIPMKDSTIVDAPLESIETH